MRKITNEQLLDFAKFYNEQGRAELYNKLRNDYDIKNPTGIFRRMKNTESLGFDAVIKKFTFHKPIEDDVFMTFDELCAPRQNLVTVNQTETKATKTVAMEKLVQELIGDKLLEISRYVTMNVSDRTIIIDRTSLQNDGYQIIAH